MGRVFLGASAEGHLAAVKVVHANLAADPEYRARFGREVEVARAVSGPFTAPVIDADLDGPVPWLATAYIAGSSLEEAVAGGGPLPPAAVLEMAARLAEGLVAIHAVGVVHRDLKPSNILLSPDGPRLIDFGVSRACGSASLTTTGVMIGSPGFMSPEQAEGLPAGPASDIFSLGAVLAFAATGQGPFGPGSTVALLYRVIHRPAELDQVPPAVRGLVDRCLIKDPALRPTARDLLAATGAPRTVPLPVPASVPPPARALVPPDLPLSLGVWEPAPAPPPRPPRRRDQPSRRRNWRSLSAAAVIAGMLGAAIGLVLTATPNPPPPPQPPRQVAAAATSAPSASTAAPVSRAGPARTSTERPHPSASESPNPHLTSGGYGY